jgi:hypothetical protein
MNNTCILCPQFFDWYSIREKVSNSIFIFRGISLFYLVYIWHCRIKLFLRHLPKCPCSDFSRYVDLFQEISPRIAKQLRFQVKLYHIRRKYENVVAYLLSYTVSVEKLWTQNTRIIHDVWRLLLLSNEEKRMIMNILKKEWFIWKFWKKGGSREKEGGGGNEIHAPCACALMQTFNVTFYNEYASSV